MFDLPWYIYLLQFVSGLLLAKASRIFVNGVSGHCFQAPFASPPGVGESPPVVNVLWGFLNLAAGFALLLVVAPKGSEVMAGSALVALGALLISRPRLRTLRQPRIMMRRRDADAPLHCVHEAAQ